MKEFLSQKGAEYMYFDISQDFGALKRFLKLRDTHILYEGIRGSGRIGIPAILIGEEVMVDFDPVKLEELLK